VLVVDLQQGRDAALWGLQGGEILFGSVPAPRLETAQGGLRADPE